MKRLVVLGSTGSIGTQTLRVVQRHPDRLRVVGLATGRNADRLRAQAREFGVERMALFAGDDPSIPSGLDAVSELASSPDVDVVVVAVAGVVGLIPTLAAIRAGKDIALASKEVLVAAGEVVMPLARDHGASILPIDSEHSAIFQCLRGYAPTDVLSVTLTASGGPFRGWTRERLARVTVDQALAHPTWTMGGKITIDSATLMNKGLETIEAIWLFGLSLEQVRVVVHPQSIVHSLVELRDGSVLAQLGWPNMELPIQVALLHPERVESGLRPWNPLESSPLTFEPVDHETFPAIRIAHEAVRRGGTTPCAFNAANEEAANAFLRGEIPFLAITDVVAEVTALHRPEPVSLETILEVDRWARQQARDQMKRLVS